MTLAQEPVASTSRLPTHTSAGLAAATAQTKPAASSPLTNGHNGSSTATTTPVPTPSILKKPEQTQLSRPYYFYHGEKRVKARIDPEVPLVEVVKQLVKSSQLALDPDNALSELYALRERETKRIVTEENLGEMLARAVHFDVVKSPSVEAQQTARKLASLDPAQLKHATFNLRTSLLDETFRRAFLKADGLPALQAIIRRGSGNTLAYALNSLHVLLDQDGGSLSFDSLFLARIVDIVALETLVNVTRPATAVLCSMTTLARRAPARCIPFLDLVLRQPALFSALVERISADDLELADLSIDLLDKLIGASVDTSDWRIPDKLDDIDAWRAIAKTTEAEDSTKATRMAALGTTFVRYLGAATAAPITEDDYHLFDEIWVASQLKDVDETNRWRRLGFRTEAPQYEFDGVGLLGLKMLKRFAEDSQNEFAKTLHLASFKTSKEEERIPLSTFSVLALRHLLDVFATPLDGASISPYLFRMAECHALAVHFLQHMWEEGSASWSDLERLSRMIKSQISHVLTSEPKSWFKVRQQFLTATYAGVRDRQLREIASDHALLAKPKSQALRARLYAEAYDRVSRQRVATLEAGAWFRLVETSPALTGKQAYPRSRDSNDLGWRFYRLSPDHATLRWYDADSPAAEKVALSAMTKTVSVSKIVEVKLQDALAAPEDGVVVNNGSEPSSPQLDSTRRRFSVLQRSLPSRPSVDRRPSVGTPLSFALILAGQPPVQIVAPDATTLAEWIDGLSLLQPNGAIVSRATLQYIESLADMGTRIKLLDLQDEQADSPPL